MIRRWAIVLLCLLAILSAESKDTYELSPLLIGADAMGRGSAYLGGSDSNHYVFQNYSFLGEEVTPRVSLTVFKLISEINYLSAAYSQDRFSLGFLHVGDSGGYLRDANDNLTGGKISYSDTTLYGAYAFDFAEYKIGARLKYQSKYFSEVDTSAWGLSLDLAGHYALTRYWTLGAELGNLLGTSLRWSDDFEEKIPLNFSFGSQFKLFGPEGWWQEWDWLALRRTDAYADLRLEERNSLLKTGVEFWPHDRVALRLGLQQVNDIEEEQNARLWRFTAGAGLNWQGVYFDYAYNPGDDIAANLTHFFTLSYRFSTPEMPSPSIEVTENPVEIVEIQPLVLRQRMFIDLDDYAWDEIYLLEDLGYLGLMIGYPGSTFRPEQPMTRKELMTVLVRLEEDLGRPFVTENILHFVDVQPGSSPDAHATARRASGSQYMLLRGYPDGEARLDIPVLRSEAAAAFARYEGIAGQDLFGTSLYHDVPLRHWAYKDINLTRQYGLTIGVGDGRYEPDVYLRRLDAARIVSRMRHIQEKRLDLPPLAESPPPPPLVEPRRDTPRVIEPVPPPPPPPPPVERYAPPAEEETYFYYEEEGEMIDLDDFRTDNTSQAEPPPSQPTPPPPPPPASPPPEENDWFIDLEY
ncbi:putative surface protein [Candidatus Termititenax persephonae]|uniref:Surface protein n=1 Tax=Candidatus Termititenax persephonae TaxID=2218525 RepID=A0A388THH4_9BACT|nr:putative surface protein [Candidatus Termititenax persephonae]